MIKRSLRISLIIALQALWILTGKSCYCQPTYPKLTVLQGDTVVCLLPPQLKVLNGQLSLLIDFKNNCDTALVKANEIIKGLKQNQQDYEVIISDQSRIINNNSMQIINLNEISKQKQKLWRRRFLYGTGGGIAAGLLIGLIIPK